ncbi:MAG: hypothetical protein ACTSPL_03325 [Candidatus Odinarchaeia archaeon]
MSRLSYTSLSKILKKTAWKAGVKKRVYPHKFRHSKLTELAKDLTEFQLVQFAGWVQDTRMAVTYVYLSGRDLDAATLEKYGLTDGKNDEENKVRHRVCPRCEVINDFEAKFCIRCGLALDIKEAYKLEKN